MLTGLDEEADFSAVAEGIERAESLLLDTIAELAAGDPAAGPDLRLAAEEMPGVALELATVLVETRGIEGEVDDEAAALRADLTAQLQESALLTGLLLEEIAANGGNAGAPGPAGVRSALTENNTTLGETLEPGNPEAAAEMADLLDTRIDLFVDYTIARLQGSATGLEEAEDALDELRDQIGARLAEDFPVSAPAVAEELVPHVESILAFADAVVAESAGGEAAQEPESPALLRDAGLATRLTARTLAGLLTAPAVAPPAEGDAEAEAE